MQRPRRRCLGVVLALAASAAPAARAQETPTFPASRDLVRVDVAVTDGKGAPVTDLTQADFTVLSDGKPVAISSFETVVVQPLAYEEPEPGAFPVSAPIAASPEQNRALLVFFDDVHLTPTGSEAAQAAIQSVLGSELQPGDWVSVVSPSGLRWTARTPAELRRLPEVARVLSGNQQRATDAAFTVSKASGMSDYQAMSVVRFGRYHGEVKPADGQDARGLPSTRIAGRIAVKRGSGEEEVPALHPEADAAVADQEQHMLAVERYTEAQHRIGRSLDALRQAIASMAAFRGRKAAIVYSEGFIKSPDVAGYDEVVRLARQTRTTFYVIDPRKLTTGMAGSDSGLGSDQRTTLATEREETGGSDYVAAATGGRAARASDPKKLFREAAAQASAYYLIGFDAPAGGVAERKLEIRTRRPDTRVHAADRYVAGAATAAAAAGPTLDEALASAFDATDVSFRVSAAAGDGSTTIGVMFDRKASDGERTLDLRVEARPLGEGEPVRDGGEITLPPADRPAMVKRTLALGPGTWQARVVARDRATGQVGSVLHTFEVPGAGAASN